jgi:hypothetical protein
MISGVSGLKAVKIKTVPELYDLAICFRPARYCNSPHLSPYRIKVTSGIAAPDFVWIAERLMFRNSAEIVSAA